MTAYIDSDGDSHGAEAVVVCAMGPGLSDSNTDCDDSNPAVNPDSIEMCDADDLDEDCDGAADNLDTAVSGTLTFYTDLDGDNWGGEATGDRCDARSGEVAVSGDCDDNDAALNGDDADGDAYSTCEGDCDDTDISLYPDTCPYTYAAGLFAVGGVCEFSMEGPATSSFPACPDCDYGFDTVATYISGGCISTFDAVMATPTPSPPTSRSTAPTTVSSAPSPAASPQARATTSSTGAPAATTAPTTAPSSSTAEAPASRPAAASDCPASPAAAGPAGSTQSPGAAPNPAGAAPHAPRDPPAAPPPAPLTA
jgi:hypothetical protein